MVDSAMNTTASATATGTEKASSNFSVSSRKVVAESADVQVKEFLLTPGEEVPWHHHTFVFDVFYCLEGTLTVQRCDVWTQQRQTDLVLRTGESAKVEPGTAHCPVNREAGNCRFLLVQGIGEYDWVRFTPPA